MWGARAQRLVDVRSNAEAGNALQLAAVAQPGEEMERVMGIEPM